jgi:hypothetical protein
MLNFYYSTDLCFDPKRLSISNAENKGGIKMKKAPR